MTPELGKLINWLVNHSLQAGILVVLVLAVQRIFRRQLAARWRFALWWIVLARLLLPFNPQSALSLFNVFEPKVQVEGPRYPAPAPPKPAPVKDSPVPDASFAAPPAPTEAPAVEVVSMPVAASPAGSEPTRTAAAAAGPGSGKAAISRHPLRFKEFLIPGLVGLWLAGVLILSGMVIVQLVRFHRKLAQASVSANPGLQRLLEDCRGEFGVSRRVELLETGVVQSPALFGLRRLRLLLPRGMAERFTSRELRYVFLHELAHVQRGDLWLNLLVTALQILHWFNPLVWLGFARLRADRELACDELALQRAGDNAGTAYGETVIKLLESLNRPAAIPGLIGILEDKQQMRRRISMIANFRKPGRWPVLAVFLIAGLAAAALTDAQTKTTGTAPKDSSSSAATPRPEITNGLEMKVTVLEAATGKPLENAEVLAPCEAGFFGGQENAPHWLTDKSGTAVIRVGEPSANPMQQMTWFTLSARKEGYAPYGFSWSDGIKDVRPGLPKEITIRLKPGTTIGGAVYDDAGAPQPGIKVRIFGCGYDYKLWQANHQEFPAFWDDSAGSSLPATDSAGRWQLKDFPSDLQNVAIEFIRPDGSVEQFRNPALAENPNEPQGDPMNYAALLAGNARFVLKPGCELHGLVVDAQGRPLPDVRIKAGYGMVNRVNAGEIRSDADGRFVWQHLNHRQVILTADAAGHAVTSQVVDLNSNLLDVRLQMGDLAPLHIQVVDKDGGAVAGAKVVTDTYHTEGQMLDFSGVTDQQGGLIWTNAPVSAFELDATSPTDPALHQNIRTTPEQREVTFHLRAGLDKSIIIVGRVTDAKTGAPVKLESVKYETADREGFSGNADVSESGFHLELPASRFRAGMYPSYQFQLIAPGYDTLVTPFRDYYEGDWDATFVLKPTIPSDGTVSLPNGLPAAGTRLWARADGAFGDMIIDGPGRYYSSHMLEARTDTNGGYSLPDVPDNQPVIFIHPDGFLSIPAAEVKRNPNVRLQPWGRVTGVVKIAGQPKGGVQVNLGTLQWNPQMGLNLGYNTSTAPDGSFTFEQVPPGELELYRSRPKTGVMTPDHQFPLVVKPGETVNVEYSNPGRAVIGQMVSDQPGLAVDWLNDDDTLTLKQPPLETAPVNWQDYATEETFQKAYNESFQSDGKMQQAREARTYVLALEQDGSFRADDVPPGTYELKVRVTKPDPDNQFGAADQPENQLGSLTREVVVPPGDAPFDLGTLRVAMRNDGNVRKAESVNFSATMLDGRAVSLAQYKGKYVVLAFWAPWSDRSTDGLKEVQKLQASLNQDPRVSFLNVSLDNDTNTVARTVAERGYQWPQAMVDPANLAKLPDTFAVNSLPAICLIDPDGRIIAHGLSGDRISASIQRALQNK